MKTRKEEHSPAGLGNLLYARCGGRAEGKRHANLGSSLSNTSLSILVKNLEHLRRGYLRTARIKRRTYSNRGESNRERNVNAKDAGTKVGLLRRDQSVRNCNMEI